MCVCVHCLLHIFFSKKYTFDCSISLIKYRLHPKSNSVETTIIKLPESEGPTFTKTSKYCRWGVLDEIRAHCCQMADFSAK